MVPSLDSFGNVDTPFDESAMPSPSLQDTPAHTNSFTQNLDNLGDDAANLFEDISKATFKIWVQLFF
jgi:hypothetical protein